MNGTGRGLAPLKAGFTPLKAGFIPRTAGFTPPRAGFTLIELLVVIAIIGLLAAIIIPSIAGALKSAKKARAMGQIRDLDGAVKRYFAEYGKMPVPAGNGGPDMPPFTGAAQGAVVEILINVTTNLNPKQIVFLDLDPASFGVKTTTEMLVKLKEGYKDPWGGDYGILMDLNFDEKIDLYGGIRAKVAVYSLGDPDNKYTAETTPFKTW
jgi:prepilin-type N-terminal cleavage/methylation domain-containing protein